MVALFIIGLLATIAWLNDLGWLVLFALFLLLIFIFGTLTTVAGVSRHRGNKEKYHPSH